MCFPASSGFFGVRNDFQRREGTRGERGAKGGGFLGFQILHQQRAWERSQFLFSGEAFFEVKPGLLWWLNRIFQVSAERLEMRSFSIHK